MNSNDMTMSDALTILHKDIARQGPGDDLFSSNLLHKLPDLPSNCRIADLGCGTGAASILLARYYRQPVLCVDTSDEFLKTLTVNARGAGLEDLITPLCADMGSLDPQQYHFDLLWSEGAAYNLTFAGAMQKWRPLMAIDGLVVVSEMSWFTDDRPQEAFKYWSEAYPAMTDEHSNVASAERHGFKLLFKERLPAEFWWTNYYGPLSAHLDANSASTSKTLQEAISETRQEIDLFHRFSKHFGYTFYILKAI